MSSSRVRMKSKKFYRLSHYLILTLGWMGSLALLPIFSSAQAFQARLVPHTVSLFNSTIQISPDGLSFETAALGKVLIQPWAALGQLNHHDNRGSFKWGLNHRQDCRHAKLTHHAIQNGTLVIKGQLISDIQTNCQLNFELVIRWLDQHPQLQLTIPGAQVTGLKVQLNPNAYVRGLGIQPSQLDLRGQRFDLIAQEGGIGRGAQPLSSLIHLIAPGSAGHAGSSYFPLPWFWAQLPESGAVTGLGLNGSRLAQFDFTRSGEIQLAQQGSELSFWLQSAANPSELIQRFHRQFGKQPAMPEWAERGVIMGVQGGTQRVREIWQRLKAAGVPVIALWLQDWVGRRKTAIGSQLWWNWELDREHYPDWDVFRAELAAEGVRLLGYLNPFLVDVSDRPHRRNLYQEALAQGFLVKTESGQPAAVQNTDFAAGLVDLTNLKAQAWLIQVIQQQLINEAGFSGWMADYAEALPLEAQLADGTSGWETHNRYPALWAKLQQQARTDPEQFWFPRAGHLGTQQYAPMIWLGDQMVDWSPEDGLRSALTGQLSAGLSGLAQIHSDAGGYTSVAQLGIKRSRELLARWVEMQSFMTMLRTHEGNQPEANAQVYDPESLPHFARMAKIYLHLYPIRQRLLREASQTGLPVVRHPLFQYGQDQTIQSLSDQFLLGDLMCAPVLEPGQTVRRLYLPAGSWVHLWSGQRYDLLKGSWIEISAPLGKLPVFYPYGSREGEALRTSLWQSGLL